MISAILVRRPSAPDARECKWTPIGHANTEWLSLAVFVLLPLVEPVRRNQTPTLFKRILEHVARRNLFGRRIDD